MKFQTLLNYFLVTFFLTTGFSLKAQNIHYVKEGGTGDGSSWSNANGNLQAMINASASGDEVWVAKGTYRPTTGTDRNISFSLKNNLAIYGGFTGAETSLGERKWQTNVTILSGDIDQNDGTNFTNNEGNSLHVVYNNSNGMDGTAILDGFTITGGNATSYDGGGGMFNNFNSSPAILNCRFLANRGTRGGGLYNYLCEPTLTNCIFSGNLATEAGGAIYNYTGGSPTITNCTFSANTAPEGGAFYNLYYSIPRLFNCILWGDIGGEIVNGAFTYTYQSNSIVQGGCPFASSCTNVLNQDPLFVGATNLHLQPCSPAIDAGDNNSNPATTDLDGNNRKVNTIDLGAYEYQGTTSATVLYVNAATSAAGDGSSWASAFANLQDALAVANSCSSVQQIWVAKGVYYPDEGGSKIAGDRNASFVLKNGLAIYGGFAGGETSLSQRNLKTNGTTLSGEIQQNANNGDNSYHVVLASNVDNTAVLDGFIVTLGNANEGGQNREEGGGMYNSDNATPTVANCSFVQNGAIANGGGMANRDASPVVTNCSFMQNSAGSEGGGAMNIVSTSSFINCVFYKNSAGVSGGAMQNADASPTLINCTLTQNSALLAGGLYNTYLSLPSLINCILWGDVGGEIGNEIEGHPTLTKCIVQGGCPLDATCNNILDADPLFVNATTGDLHLQPCSPAIDAGSDADNSTIADLDNNTRKADAVNGGGQIDMGAFEFQTDLDADNDGYSNCNNQDCDDNNPAIHATLTWYKDSDGDGYSNGATLTQCTRPTGYKLSTELTSTSGDCNDGDASINPKTLWVLDNDKDGYYFGSPVMQCPSPGPGYVVKATQQGGDCSDNNAGINPGAAEVCGNGIDDNCNGKVDEAGCSACNNAGGLNTTSITANSATLKWTAVANPVQWQVEYKQISTGSKWTTITLAGYLRSFTISSLKANQRYQWHIRAKCGNSWTSFTNTVSFTTPSSTRSIMARENTESLAVAGSIEKADAFNVYPNPTTGQFTIDLQLSDKINGTAKVQIIDITGRSVHTGNEVITNGALQKKLTISSSLASGVYMLKLTAGNNSYLARLIYQK